MDEFVVKLRTGLSNTAKRFGARVVRHGAKILRGRRVRTQGFQERLYSRWAHPLDLYELCLYVAQNCGDYFNRQFRPKAAAQNATQREMQRIKRDYDAVLARYGADFRQGYAWARPALLRHNPKLKGDKISFDHLQAAVNVQHWTPDYRMASHAVHPSATFIRFSLGSREDVPVIMAGPSNADLTDPGQGALLSLTNATAALLTYETESGSLERLEHRVSLSAMVLALNVLSDFAAREFVKVHRELEDEIRTEKGALPKVSGRAPRRGKV